MGVCNCSLFCCTLLYVHSSIAIILMGKRELVALLRLSSWCLVMVGRLFLAMPRGCLWFVIVVFPGHTHLLFLMSIRDGMLAWYMVPLSFLRQVGECGLLFILLNNIKDALCGHVRTLVRPLLSFRLYMYQIWFDIVYTNCRHSNHY